MVVPMCYIILVVPMFHPSFIDFRSAIYSLLTPRHETVVNVGSEVDYIHTIHTIFKCFRSERFINLNLNLQIVFI